MNTLNNYQKSIDNAKKFAKRHKIDLSIYDFKMLDEVGFNCSFTWNPKSKKMPKVMYEREFFTNKKRRTYVTYIQLSSKCKSICMMTRTAKEVILDEFKEVKVQEKKDRDEKKRIQRINNDSKADMARMVEKEYGCDIGRLYVLSEERKNKIKEIISKPGID